MTPATLLRDTLTAAAAAITAIPAAAAAARLTVGVDTLRELFALRFQAPPGDLEQAGRIFIHNAAIAALPLVAAIADPARRSALRGCADVVIAATATSNLLLAAGALAAHPLALARFAAPYAPLELCGFAAATVTYLHARRRPLPAPTIATAAAITAALLATAAVLEGLTAGQL